MDYGNGSRERLERDYDYEKNVVFRSRYRTLRKEENYNKGDITRLYMHDGRPSLLNTQLQRNPPTRESFRDSFYDSYLTHCLVSYPPASCGHCPTLVHATNRPCAITVGRAGGDGIECSGSRIPEVCADNLWCRGSIGICRGSVGGGGGGRLDDGCGGGGTSNVGVCWRKFCGHGSLVARGFVAEGVMGAAPG